MPIYEYRCQSCRAGVSVFVRSIATHVAPDCGECEAGPMARLMSSFAMGKTVAGVHESAPMGSRSPDYYRDPRNIGRHVEESFSRHGVAMPDSVRQSIDSARSGETPKGLDL